MARILASRAEDAGSTPARDKCSDDGSLLGDEESRFQKESLRTEEIVVHCDGYSKYEDEQTRWCPGTGMDVAASILTLA